MVSQTACGAAAGGVLGKSMAVPKPYTAGDCVFGQFHGKPGSKRQRERGF
jgi:hypothetical protein